MAEQLITKEQWDSGRWLEGKVVAVDFDGTCVHRAYPQIGKPVEASVHSIKTLMRMGAHVFIWTCRSEAQYPLIQDWLRDYKLEDLEINVGVPWPEPEHLKSPKVHADIYIDDLAIGVPLKNSVVDWGQVMKLIYNRILFEYGGIEQLAVERQSLLRGLS